MTKAKMNALAGKDASATDCWSPGFSLRRPGLLMGGTPRARATGVVIWPSTPIARALSVPPATRYLQAVGLFQTPPATGVFFLAATTSRSMLGGSRR